MEDLFFEAISQELEQDVENKETWLHDLIKLSEDLSNELFSISESLERLFSSFKMLSSLLSQISSFTSLPQLISSFSETLTSLTDEALSFKYRKFSADLSKWTSKLHHSLQLLEVRSHCKKLYEKILAESIKITQDHRVKEMEMIKEEYWSSYVIKHKEFQQALDGLKSSSLLHFIGPVCETILLSSEFLRTHSDAFAGLKQEAKIILQGLRAKNYPIGLEYTQKDLKFFHDENELFRYQRKLVAQWNAIITKSFVPAGSNELNVAKGDRFCLRTGEFHVNWNKGIGFSGEKGFIPRICLKEFKAGKFLQEADRVYKVAIVSDKGFLIGLKSHVEAVKGFLDSYQKSWNGNRERNFIKLVGTLAEIRLAGMVLLDSLTENPEVLKDYSVFLPFYLESYELCIKLLQRSPNKLLISPFLCTISQEIKSYISHIRKYCYGRYTKSQSSWLYEIVEVLSFITAGINKSLITVPTEKEVIQFLEDSKQKPVKRITVQQNSLILMQDFIVFASVPVKLKKIIPVSSVVDVEQYENSICIRTNRKDYSFLMDSEKRAADWVAEIEQMLVKTDFCCSVCNEVNIVKVVSQCYKCGKYICWICECTHN